MAASVARTMKGARHFESGARPWNTVRNLSRLRPVKFWEGAKIMAKTNLRLVAPDSELRTVALRRPNNRDMGRDREHLTELEGSGWPRATATASAMRP